jgi:hypothetical protein
VNGHDRSEESSQTPTPGRHSRGELCPGAQRTDLSGLNTKNRPPLTLFGPVRRCASKVCNVGVQALTCLRNRLKLVYASTQWIGRNLTLPLKKEVIASHAGWSSDSLLGIRSNGCEPRISDATPRQYGHRTRRQVHRSGSGRKRDKNLVPFLHRAWMTTTEQAKGVRAS